MAITSNDIEFRLSTLSGSAGNTISSNNGGNHKTALGKYMSTTVVPNTMYNVFDHINGGQAHKGATEYRCIFVLNNHATLTLGTAKIYISDETPYGANSFIALDNIAISNKGSSSAQATSISSEDVVPVGVGTFVSPKTTSSALVIGDLGPGKCKAIWIKRVIEDLGSMDLDGCAITVWGETS